MYHSETEKYKCRSYNTKYRFSFHSFKIYERKDIFFLFLEINSNFLFYTFFPQIAFFDEIFTYFEVKIYIVLGKIRFFSFSSLLLIPIFAIVKIAWEFYTTNAQLSLVKPYPIAWLDSEFPLNIFIGIIFIFAATYFIFAYINAFVNTQTTYAIALFFAILMLLSFTPELSSSLFASILLMNGILRLLSLNEKQKGSFIVFDTGFFTGLALLFEIKLLLIALVLSVFLFLFRFSFRQFSQYWAGVLIPFLFAFPLIYFLGLLPDWQRYFNQFSTSFIILPNTNTADYILISILLFFCIIQTTSLYWQIKKPTQRLLIIFLFVYFVLSLLTGIFTYAIHGAYLILVIPAISMLYSLSQHENHRIPIFIIIAVIGYFLWQLKLQYAIIV